MRDLCSVARMFRLLLRTTYFSTDSVIKTLIGFAIQRGVLVTMVQAAFLVVFYFSSSHLYWYVERNMFVHRIVDVMMPTE